MAHLMISPSTILHTSPIIGLSSLELEHIVVSAGERITRRLRDSESGSSISDRYDGFIGTWALCYCFAAAFRGDISAHYLTTGKDEILPAMQSLFNIDRNILTATFELAVPNLSQTLVDLSSNLTLSLIASRYSQNNTMIVSATVWDGTNVWVYSTWILWAAYLPTLLLAMSVGLYGLYTIHTSGIAMDDKFSSLLLATRNTDLDDICKEASDFDELQRYRVIHQTRGTFSVDSGYKPPN